MTDRDVIEHALVRLQATADVPQQAWDAAQEAMERELAGATRQSGHTWVEAPKEHDVSGIGRVRGVLLIAASIVLVVGVVLTARTLRTPTPPVDVASAEALPLSPGSGPARLEPGSYVTEILGTTVAFDLTEAVWVSEYRPGLLRFEVDPSDPGGSRLTFFRVDTDLPAMFESLEPSDRVRVTFVPVEIDGTTVNRWYAGVPAAYADAAGCVSGQVCVPLFVQPEEQGLVAGPDNVVVMVEQSPYLPIVIINHPAATIRNRISEPDQPFDALIESLVLGDPQPAPLPLYGQ